jgi:hypothetical protein
MALTPAAHADMALGNYDFHTDWDPTHRWVWALRTCNVNGPANCLHVTAVPRPNGGAAPYQGDVQLDANQYTMIADAPTGLICSGSAVPTHNTYTWDPDTLAGSVTSTFDMGCAGAPGGTFTYAFTLTRL